MVKDVKQQAKRSVHVTGEVQFPVKIGEEACYLYGDSVWWTDRVKRILEIAADYIRIETTHYYYTIVWNDREQGRLRVVAYDSRKEWESGHFMAAFSRYSKRRMDW